MWPAAWRPRSNIELRKTSFCRAEADCWMLFINTMLQSRSGIASPDVIFSFRTLRQVRRRLKSRTDESRQCRILGHLIEPAFLVRVRAQNDGFIRLGEPFSAGRGAIGKSVEKGQLIATIADEETSRELKQARADLQAAVDRAAVPLPSSELLKAAEDNLQRLGKVVSSR